MTMSKEKMDRYSHLMDSVSGATFNIQSTCDNCYRITITKHNKTLEYVKPVALTYLPYGTPFDDAVDILDNIVLGYNTALLFTERK